jgi:hypothetical protein
LQNVFNTSIIFKSDLNKYLLTHTYPVNNITKQILNNQEIDNQLYIDFDFENLIYNDSSSLFWLEPTFNTVLNQESKLTYTWPELVMSFEKYIESNKSQQFDYCNQTFITFNDQTCSLLNIPSKIIHKSQMLSILKQRTLFLGRTNTLLSACPFLTLPTFTRSHPTIIWLENLINNSKLITWVSSDILL